MFFILRKQDFNLIPISGELTVILKMTKVNHLVANPR